MPATAPRMSSAPTEGRRLIDDLADFGVPVLLFSGGEPLLRADIMTLIAHARERGLRAVLSSNGTLITPAVAAQLQELGLVLRRHQPGRAGSHA